MVGLFGNMKNCGIATKLTLLFGVFGLIPIVALGWISWKGANNMEEAVGAKFQDTALTIADKIDRNLFERYGDVQAFALNTALQRTTQWYDSTEYGEIAPVLDKYITTYGIYYLTLLVDTKGQLIAVNRHDRQGKPINYQFLYEKDFSQTPWFQALEKKEFTTKMAFSAPENQGSTGTYIEDMHIDKDVKQAYPGDSGMTIGFSTPIYGDNGEVIGYWSNRAQFSLVEEIIGTSYTALKNQGYPGGEITLLNESGVVLVDYDPIAHGKEAPNHDFDKVVFKLNLAEKGVQAAQEAVAGKTGFMTSLHARKKIQQAGGYTHLKGVLGYPGMNWSVLVRIPQDEAAADSRALMNQVWMMAVGCLVIILPMGLLVGRWGAKQIQMVQTAAGKMAEGDYGVRVAVSSADEIGQLGDSFNHMAEEIQSTVQKVEEASVREKEQAAVLKTGVEQIASIATTLAGAAEELNSVNGQMSTMADETSNQATVVSAAAEEVSRNIQSVATGSEEMSASIQEIAQNTTGSARVAAQAVTAAETANGSVAKLGESSAEIGSIIKVITTIAEQTNLLALNATIEAARAGDAGKGFAVVANEVKELAKETTKATENIGKMIETIQADTTGAVGAIEEIATIIKQVNDYQNTIASAVEEQSATTNEMSRNVNEASKGGMEIANNIVSVAEAASSTNEGTKQTKNAAEELARLASDLQQVVSQLA